MRAHVKTLLALLLGFGFAVSVSAQAPALNPARVAQVAVKTKDLQRATAFYRDTIGLKVLISNKLVSILDCGGMTLLLGPNEPDSRVYFEVEDIQKAVEMLSNRGVKIEVNVYTGSLQRVISGYLQKQDVQFIMMRPGASRVMQYLRTWVSMSRFVKPSPVPPVLLVHPSNTAQR